MGRKMIFFHKSHGMQHGGRKGGLTQRWVNGAPIQVLGGQTQRVNGQHQIVQPGN